MELRLMRSAFKLLFNVSDEIVDTPEIQKWMKDAPVGIVEYEGYLTGEDNTFRDYRMQMSEIYDGDFDSLSDFLKEMDSSLSTLPKWAVIFKTYNGIKSSDDLISQAEKYCSTAEKRAEEDRARQMSELSKRPHEVQQTVEAAPTLEDLLESSPVVDSTPSTAVEETPVIKTEVDSMETVQAEALGKAEVESEEPFTNNKNYDMSKEDEKMADLNTNTSGTTAQEEVIPTNFDAAMSTLAGEQNFGEQSAPGNSKPKTVNTDNTIAKDVLRNSEKERAAFVKSNFVTQLICAAEPSVTRLVSKAEEGSKLTGRFFKNTDMEHRKMTDAIDKEIRKFEKATGCSFHSVDENADPQVSFPRCFGSADAKVAAQVYGILKTLLATPTAQVRIKKGKETYQTKGYVVTGDQYLNDVDMKSLIMLKSTGAIYGAGQLDADGKPMADAVCFKLTIVKPRTTNSESGSKVNGSNKNENNGFKANIVGVKKVDFLKNAANRIIIKTTSATEKTFSKFKAAVEIEGALQEASFRYRAYDEEGKQLFVQPKTVVAGDTKQEAKPMVKTYTLGVYAEVYAVSDEINSALIGKNDKLQNADAVKAHFNVKTAVGRDKAAAIDYTSEMSDAIATSLTLMENGALDSQAYGAGVGELIAKVAAATSEADSAAVEAQQKGMM